ncbi:uncharacterized protein Dsimw501_GD27604 [Drosophila simulans]|nr:uncharacterized protein Dsimw501_GD27604 [Drosophila simulans]
MNMLLLLQLCECECEYECECRLSPIRLSVGLVKQPQHELPTVCSSAAIDCGCQRPSARICL